MVFISVIHSHVLHPSTKLVTDFKLVQDSNDCTCCGTMRTSVPGRSKGRPQGCNGWYYAMLRRKRRAASKTRAQTCAQMCASTLVVPVPARTSSEAKIVDDDDGAPRLPRTIWRCVSRWLDAKSLARVQSTSKEWREDDKLRSLWKELIDVDFVDQRALFMAAGDDNWQRFYARQTRTHHRMLGGYCGVKRLRPYLYSEYARYCLHGDLLFVADDPPGRSYGVGLRYGGQARWSPLERSRQLSPRDVCRRPIPSHAW